MDSDQILKTVVELSKEISLSEDQIAKMLDLFQVHSNKVKAAVDKNQDQQEKTIVKIYLEPELVWVHLIKLLTDWKYF